MKDLQIIKQLLSWNHLNATELKRARELITILEAELQSRENKKSLNVTINTDKQEFIQDIESALDYLIDPDHPEPEEIPEPMKEFNSKLIELANIHSQLKMLGY